MADCTYNFVNRTGGSVTQLPLDLEWEKLFMAKMGMLLEAIIIFQVYGFG